MLHNGTSQQRTLIEIFYYKQIRVVDALTSITLKLIHFTENKLENIVCGISGTLVSLFVTGSSGKNHFLLPFPFFETGVYCFTLMTMSSDNRYCQHFSGHLTLSLSHACGTLKCENAAICEKVAKCEKYSTLNVKIDAICEKITLNVKK